MLKCKICEADFARKDSIKAHILRMHKGEDSENAIVFNRTFTLKQEHQNIPFPKIKNDFLCILCNMTFSKEVNYIVHNATFHSIIVRLKDFKDK